MSIYAQTWLIQLTAISTLVLSVFVRSGWLTAFGIALFVIAMFWPRCPKCKLPTFWRRGSKDPDHFVYYLGKRLPGRSCSRCGEDLSD